MEPLEVAILRTLLYADVFQFPLTLAEIHHALICDAPTSLDDVQHVLQHSRRLEKLICTQSGYYALHDKPEIIQRRIACEATTQQLWPIAVRYGMSLAKLPFVRMVALTGALAVRNPADIHDDFDYLLVTAPGRVWIARAFAIVMVRLARLRDIEICPNFVLAEDKLAQQRRDLYTAHEVAQIVPLYGEHIYTKLRAINDWSNQYLPNSSNQAGKTENVQSLGIAARFLKRSLEFVLGGWLGNRIEQWEYRRKSQRFSKQIHQPESAAEISSNQVKGHFVDHGRPVLDQYYERLRNYGIEPHPLARTGD